MERYYKLYYFIKTSYYDTGPANLGLPDLAVHANEYNQVYGKNRRLQKTETMLRTKATGRRHFNSIFKLLKNTENDQVIILKSKQQNIYML